MSKLAVIFPGIGYTKDKPLLYYTSKLLATEGYEIINVDFHDLPKGAKGDEEKMREVCTIGYHQAEEQLRQVDFKSYNRVVFVGKSMGTIVEAWYADEHKVDARLVLLTPLEATFNFKFGEAIAFIGDADPWSDVPRVLDKARKHGTPIHTYSGCNHSLEGADTLKNIEFLKDVMEKEKEFIGNVEN